MIMLASKLYDRITVDTIIQELGVKTDLALDCDIFPACSFSTVTPYENTGKVKFLYIVHMHPFTKYISYFHSDDRISK